MKYADKEAEEYVKAEEANKLAKEARTKKQDYQRKPRTYNNQNQVETLEQVQQKTGIEFGQKPLFTRTKPKSEV